MKEGRRRRVGTERERGGDESADGNDEVDGNGLLAGYSCEHGRPPLLLLALLCYPRVAGASGARIPAYNSVELDWPVPACPRRPPCTR